MRRMAAVVSSAVAATDATVRGRNRRGVMGISGDIGISSYRNRMKDISWLAGKRNRVGQEPAAGAVDGANSGSSTQKSSGPEWLHRRCARRRARALLEIRGRTAPLTRPRAARPTCQK